MDLDAFFVSVEYLRDSKLKGKPLIIGGHSRRGVVASCSYEARQFGIHSAMPIMLAKQLCPDVLIISGDMEAYSKYSKIITEVINKDAPIFEKASIDEFYIDISGMDTFFNGCTAGPFFGGIHRRFATFSDARPYLGWGAIATRCD